MAVFAPWGCTAAYIAVDTSSLSLTHLHVAANTQTVDACEFRW